MKQCKFCDWVEEPKSSEVYQEYSDHLIDHIEETDLEIDDLEVERQEMQDELLDIVGEKAIVDLIDYK